MSRRGWRFLLGAVLIVALAGLGLSLTRRASVSELVSTSFLASQALPELLQRIRNFHRVITREGRKVLEVSASEASYFKNDKAIEIVAPKVVFYEGGERVGEVSATRGRLFLDGTDVQSVEVSGEVLFELGRLRLMTDNLTYDKASSHINAHGVARVSAAELDLTGTDMTVDMLNRSVVIGTGVSMTLRPHAETPS
ncbi:MAG TPA: LPS export ABC transporter periplasmic protein LptC [Candidatus Limnocylindrales bacterium]|nr:LPS export ABC transporter periplasmic protein LptC [Candidatus Limnocylindrales bacterium]